MIETSPALTSTSSVLRALQAIRVARKGVIALAIKVAGGGLALALQVCLARTLGHAGYGEYAYVFAWLQLTLIFAQGGFSTAASRYVAEYRACHQLALARGFIKFSSRAVVLTSTLLAILMAGIATVLQYSGVGVSAWSFFIAAVTLPVLAQFALYSAVVRASGYVIPSMLVGLSQPLILLVTLLASYHFLRLHVSSSDALLLHLIAAVCALLMVYAQQRRLGTELHSSLRPAFRTADWLATATHFFVVSGLFHLLGRTGVIFSGLLLDTQAAGTYAAMERLSDVALLGLASINLLVAPKFAALHAQQRKLDLQRYARLAASGSIAIMLATAIPLILFGNQMLQFYGEDFVSGYSVLLVLLAGVAVNAACGSVGYLLIMTGHQRDTVIVASLSLLLSFSLCVLLIPRYGILGTSIANAVSMAISSVSMLLVVRVRLGIWCIGLPSK